MIEFSLVLPVLNEADFISAVVSDIQKVLNKNKISFEIILVENESEDDTWKALKSLENKDKRIRAIQAKRGYGSAVLAGLRVVRGKYAGYMPSDGQIAPQVLPILYKVMTTKSYDAVKIKRENRESAVRLIRSKVFNFIAGRLFSTDPVDINGSPRIFSTDKLKVLGLSSPDSFIDTEFALKAHLLGWKIKEIPVKNLSRMAGSSTVNIKTVFEFLRNFSEYRLGNKLKNWKITHNL